jgi:hypothetical protein
MERKYKALKKEGLDKTYLVEDTPEQKAVCTVWQDKGKGLAAQDADLIIDAFKVASLTGKTPSELAEEIRSLREGKSVTTSLTGIKRRLMAGLIWFKKIMGLEDPELETRIIYIMALVPWCMVFWVDFPAGFLGVVIQACGFALWVKRLITENIGLRLTSRHVHDALQRLKIEHGSLEKRIGEVTEDATYGQGLTDGVELLISQRDNARWLAKDWEDRHRIKEERNMDMSNEIQRLRQKTESLASGVRSVFVAIP